MRNSDIKALFFDIDGTLVSFRTHHVPESTIEAIREAKTHGVKVFISTGRPKALINNLGAIDDLIDGYITTNGAYCFAGDTEIVCKLIPRGDVDAIMQKVDELGVSCIVVGKEGLLAHNHTPQLEEVEKMLATGEIFEGSVSLDELQIGRAHV